ncbi:hypothetical protein GCM10010976_33960 [Bizionia arctica]|uniref:LamG-like jellyroll fold domain-containing protein n=2 Tax=Bizionia arctica TaxID=1495645 RepID=A0A917GXU8_9FLAO|nr:hypothetical protein GCM10010976_33960 [Bizionia arctica]
MCFSLIGYAQNFDHIYSDTVEGSAVEINFNDISACQSNVVLNITEFRNLSYPTNLCANLFVKYKVFVNDVEIGDYCTGEAQSFDLSTYGAINNVKIVGYNTYNDIDDTIKINANLVVSSSLVAMPATSPTTSELSYCLNTSATALTATLTGGATRLKWYTTNSGGLPSNSVIPNTSVLGSTIYWVSQADAVGCESERSSVVVTVYDTPNIPTAEAQEFCESRTVADLVPEPSATIVWYDVETEGVILSSTSELTTGTYYVSEVNANGCESERVSVNVSVNSILAPIAEAQAFCGVATVADLLPESSSTIIWYDLQTEGSPLSSTTSLTAGTYYVSETNANGCESERTAVNISINGVPHAPTANSVQIYTSEATIADLTATGTGLLWYDVATNGTSLDLTVSLVDGTTYYVSQTTTCGESLKTAITVKEISEASQAFCGSATVENLTSTPSADATVSWYSEATGGTALENTTALATGTYYIEESMTGSVTTLLSDLYNPTGVAVQSGGKILLSDYNGSSIIRMNADGTNIETLGNGFESARDVVIEADGKILVLGTGDIQRMNTDGSNIETLIEGYLYINSVSVQADGKIIFFDFYEGSLKRMNADGTAIETLNDYFELDSEQIAIQADGKIVVANLGFRSIMRFNADGTNLETVGGVFDYPTGVAIQADGKIVVATQNGEIKRMNPDGTGLETIANVSSPGKLAIEADGKILVVDDNTIKRITEAYTSNRVAVSVIINEAPEAPTVSTPVTYNQGDTASALTATSGGTGLLWYTSETGDTALTEAPTPNTDTIGSTSYWVTSTNDNGCESERIEIVVTIYSPATHLNFDGVKDYVDCENILPASYTKEAWISMSAFTSANNIISGSNNSGQHALWVPNGILSAGHNGSWNGVVDPDILSLNTWYHVAVSYDSATQEMKLYKDGILVATNNNIPAPINGNKVIIGGYSPSEGNFLWNGSIDDVRIWDVVRSADQINSSKNCELQGSESSLVAYYKFNQGGDTADNTAITTLTDATVNAHDGTLANFTLSGTTSNFLAGSPITTGSTIPNAPTTTTSITYEVGDTASILTATTDGSGVLWYTTETGGTGDVNAPTPSTETVGSTSYWVTSTNENGCESERVEVEVTVEETLGVNENEMLKNINIYPNPTNAYVTITLPNTQESKITVYDLNGRLLLNQSNTNGDFKIDLSAYQAGVYLLKIEVNQNQVIKRIIKN